MLALTDAALAHLCVAATAIHPRARSSWLREIAAKLDPPRIPANLRGADREPAKQVVRGEAAKRRRADDTRRWRERLANGKACYTVEVDAATFDLMERFGGLKDSKTADRQAVATALGKLLRRALQALLRDEGASRR
jgi:hypothetical protein